MDAFTPRSIISGRVKASREPALETAAYAAAALLGCDSVALVISRVKDDIWYLAAPAADIASHLGAATPLAAALPGTSHHEGDGAYLCNLANGLQAVVVKSGEALQSFVGTPAMVTRFAAQEEATASHTCADTGLPWLLPAAVSQRRDTRLITTLTASGLLVGALAAGAWLWAATAASEQTELARSMRQDQLSAWTEAARTLEPSAYPKALADLQKAVSHAVKEKGALVKFDHQNGQSTWTLNANGRVVTGVAN